MPLVYPQHGPGFPRRPGSDPALDGLRQLGSLSATGSGSTGPLNPHRLTESDSWVAPSNPPAATPPAQIPIHQHMLNSLRMAGKGFGNATLKAPPALSEKPAPNTAG